ncbi:hypothetical protein [Streptomyces graminofaciens]|uniref:hypothetical protein n=1 Tax=Streptomyces graminofaciens TaxID=68212 RepID=UPI002574732F|nr:hypothetical protein [Streptomyces graminofaciens]
MAALWSYGVHSGAVRGEGGGRGGDGCASIAWVRAERVPMNRLTVAISVMPRCHC